MPPGAKQTIRSPRENKYLVSIDMQYRTLSKRREVVKLSTLAGPCTNLEKSFTTTANAEERV